MKRPLTYLLLTIVASIALHCSFLSAQNYVQDMTKVMQKYKSGDVAFQVRYIFYPDDSARKAADSMKVICRVSGENYYSEISSDGESYEYFRNSRYYFVIDHDESVIAVRKSTDARQNMWDISKLDSLVHAPGVKVTYKESGKQTGEYDILTGNPVWNRVRIVFNISDHTLKATFMYSNLKGKMYGIAYDKPCIGMYYSNFKEAPFDKSIFSNSKFFSETSKGIVLTEQYKRYKLLDYVKNN